MLALPWVALARVSARCSSFWRTASSGEASVGAGAVPPPCPPSSRRHAGTCLACSLCASSNSCVRCSASSGVGLRGRRVRRAPSGLPLAAARVAWPIAGLRAVGFGAEVLAAVRVLVAFEAGAFLATVFFVAAFFATTFFATAFFAAAFFVAAFLAVVFLAADFAAGLFAAADLLAVDVFFAVAFLAGAAFFAAGLRVVAALLAGDLRAAVVFATAFFAGAFLVAPVAALRAPAFFAAVAVDFLAALLRAVLPLAAL